MGPLTFLVARDPEGAGWVVMVQGRVARSLPYWTKEEAIEAAEELTRRYPSSWWSVSDEPAPAIPDPLAPPVDPTRARR